jgi:energy-coupling factor transport system permease protein
MRKLAYFSGKSLLHRLYPLTKLVWLILGTILLLVLTNSWIILFLTCTCLIALLRIYPRIWHVRGFRLVNLTGFVLFLLYLLFNKTGDILLNPGLSLMQITSGGLMTGLRFSGRFMTIVFLSYLFILTTEPSDLAYALMKLGLPYRYGFMLVTALRLGPILEDEGQTIYKAQLTRGVRYDQGGPKKVILLTTQFLTPLLISALQRADSLVFSMEGRGFDQYPERTFRSRTKPSQLDLIFNILMAINASTCIIINFGGIS